MSKTVPLVNGSRAVGIMANGQVLMPVFPRDAETAVAYRDNLHSHLGAVALLDHIYGSASAFEANRTVVYDAQAEREARAEIKAQVDSERVVASHCRRQAELDAELGAELAQQKLDAAREFKVSKFDLGKARMAKRQAEAKVEESVAREGMREEVIEPAPAPPVKEKAPTAAKVLAGLVDELETAIINAEADGKPTTALRAQQDALNIALRRKLMEEDE